MTKENIVKAADEAIEMFSFLPWESATETQYDRIRTKCAVIHYEKIIELAKSVDLYFKVDDYQDVLAELKSRPQQEFVKANPGMQHVEGFVSGKIVNVWNRDDKVDFQQAKYRFFADGKHWVETCSADLVVTFKNIEKIADAELNEIADNLIACSGFYLSDKIPLAVVKPMLVEMGKKVKHGL